MERMDLSDSKLDSNLIKETYEEMEKRCHRNGEFHCPWCDDLVEGTIFTHLWNDCKGSKYMVVLAQ